MHHPPPARNTDAVRIAADLRRLADLIETVGDVSPAQLSVSVGIQAVPYAGTDEDRIAAVTAVAQAVVPDVALTTTGSEQHQQFRTEPLAPRIGGVDLSIYGAVGRTEPTGGAA